MRREPESPDCDRHRPAYPRKAFAATRQTPSDSVQSTPNPGAVQENVHRLRPELRRIGDEVVTVGSPPVRKRMAMAARMLMMITTVSLRIHKPACVTSPRLANGGSTRGALRAHIHYLVADQQGGRLYKPSGPSSSVSMTSLTCRLWASCRTVAMIFSIRTAISPPIRFCSSVARLLPAGGE